MSSRVVGIAKDTREEVPIGSDRILWTSADCAAPWQQLHLEHSEFETLDKPEMIISDPYVALILGEPLVNWKQDGRWRQHKFRSGQLSIKHAGDLGPFQSPDGCEVVLVSIEAGVLSDMATQMGVPASVELVDNITADNEFLRGLVLALKEEAAASFPGGRMLYESLQATLASYLLTHYSTWDRRPLQRRSYSGGLSPRALKRMEDYVLEHLEADISLSELAQVAFLSPYHFSRMFKISTGFSPYNYVSTVRVRKAAALMKGGDNDIAQIARAVGFRDSRALSRHFKRVIGESPSSYLKHIE